MYLLVYVSCGNFFLLNSQLVNLALLAVQIYILATVFVLSLRILQMLTKAGSLTIRNS